MLLRTRSNPQIRKPGFTRKESSPKSKTSLNQNSNVDRILCLQQTWGNAALQRFFASKPGSANSAADLSSVNRSTRLVEKSLSQKPTTLPFIQRQTADAHNLTAPILSGDPVLEDCFDGLKILKLGATGSGVQKLQQALAQLGYLNPAQITAAYQADTKQAVIRFQKDAGLTGTDVDGIVGKKTLGLLDPASRHGMVETDTHVKEQDFRIEGKYDESAKEPKRIFFELGKSDLDGEEQGKINTLAQQYKLEDMTLKGYASEEGPVSVNKDLARDRVNHVSQALFDAGHAGLHVLEPRAEAGMGVIDYRYMRAVKILVGDEKEKPEPTCPPNMPTSGPCPPDIVDLIAKRSKDAVGMIENTEKLLPPKTPDQISVFDNLFRTNTLNRDQAAVNVQDILGRMKAHIADMPKPVKHKCGNECDGICKTGSPGYNSDTPGLAPPNTPNPPGVLTVCPSFPAYTKNNKTTEYTQAIILCHEGHHGTPGIPSADYAYSDTRLLTQLDTGTALKNAASFEVLIDCYNNNCVCNYGPKQPDVYDPGLTAGPERQQLDLDIAWIEQWLNMAKFDLSSFYSGVRDTRAKNFWDSDLTLYFMNYIAPRFDLTRPPILPVEKDQNAAAAIYDRIVQMKKPFKKSLSFSKVAAGQDQWQDGPGQAVTLTQAFFALPPSRQTVALVQELVQATKNISARLEPEYVALIYFLKEYRNLGGPTP